MKNKDIVTEKVLEFCIKPVHYISEPLIQTIEVYKLFYQSKYAYREDGVVENQVEFRGSNTNVQARTTVWVKACVGFYVYRLFPSPGTNYRYCEGGLCLLVIFRYFICQGRPTIAAVYFVSLTYFNTFGYKREKLLG